MNKKTNPYELANAISKDNDVLIAFQAFVDSLQQKYPEDKDNVTTVIIGMLLGRLENGSVTSPTVSSPCYFSSATTRVPRALTKSKYQNTLLEKCVSDKETCTLIAGNIAGYGYFITCCFRNNGDATHCRSIWTLRRQNNRVGGGS